MKIAIPLPSFHKNGGIERHTYELVSNWKDKHEIHIFSYNWIELEGVTFHRIPGENLPRLIKGPWFLIYTYFLLKKNKFDVIINNGCGQSLIQDVIITASVHKAWMYSFKKLKLKRFFLNPLHYITLFVEWLNYRFHRYTKIICVSYFIQKELCKFHKVSIEDTKVIHLGVNTEEFSPEKRNALRKSSREKYKFYDNDKILLFAAHEWKRKGLDSILITLKRLPENYKLLIVGNPSARESVLFKKKVSLMNLTERVIFGGLCKNMLEAYAVGDIFVFPSTFDAFALVVLEAMSSGLPVITTSTVGASELINNGKNGFVLNDWKDIEEMKKIILSFFNNDEYYSDISKNARTTALSFTWEKVAKETEYFLEEIVNKNK
ncbi:MAG: glycosyltransferase family 4 protein [Brevinematia bacterium]